jgi:hypothetical protein
MQCAVRRWGPGTTCERPSNSAASKELQEKLAKMNQERMNQDKMWDTTSTATTATTVSKTDDTVSIKKK